MRSNEARDFSGDSTMNAYEMLDDCDLENFADAIREANNGRD